MIRISAKERSTSISRCFLSRPACGRSGFLPTASASVTRVTCTGLWRSSSFTTPRMAAIFNREISSVRARSPRRRQRASVACSKRPEGGRSPFGSKTVMRSSCGRPRGQTGSLAGSALANVAAKSRLTKPIADRAAGPEANRSQGPVTAFRRLVASEKPLVLPGAHDAISARLIQRAGFKAYFIGGFPLVGARYGVPDIGLMGLGEIGAGIRDIMAASDLPVLVDCDNGYGDVKTVVHAINTYERLGAQAVFFEDQMSPKRCGHIQGKQLLSTEQMEANIRAAAENRFNPETFIIARTDAREVFDLDEALRRGERYIRAGADGLFIEAPVNVDELERIGRAFDVPQLANMLEGGRTPFLTPAELEQLGFRLAIYGISLLMHAVQATQRVLTSLAHGKIDFAGKGVGFEEYKSIVGFEHWAALEAKYQPPPRAVG